MRAQRSSQSLAEHACWLLSQGLERLLASGVRVQDGGRTSIPMPHPKESDLRNAVLFFFQAAEARRQGS